MTEQRYSDDEVRKIFDRAASTEPAGTEEASAPAGSTDEGFTLAELQDIGREAGLEPARIAEAAAAIQGGRGRGVVTILPRQTSWGMPVAVGRIVDLPRGLTDREWEMLVAELRSTFRARGRARSDGSLREWVNGNLVVSVEPSETGYRLRLGTMKGNAMILNLIGVAGVGMAGFMLVASGMTELGDAFTYGAIGIGALGANMVRLPLWAQTRERQMEYVAGRVQTILASSPKNEGPKSGS